MILRVKNKKGILKDPRLNEFRELNLEITADDTYANWGGMITQDDLPVGAKLKENPPYWKKENPCFMFYMSLTVTSAGKATVCGCMNSEAEELIIGDCRSQSLKDIWNNKSSQRIKASFGTDVMPEICKACSMYQDGIDFSTSPDVMNFKEGHYPFGF
jgi:radical SAM protein with 4Fe4S-binding SPASM domain